MDVRIYRLPGIYAILTFISARATIIGTRHRRVQIVINLYSPRLDCLKLFTSKGFGRPFLPQINENLYLRSCGYFILRNQTRCLQSRSPVSFIYFPSGVLSADCTFSRWTLFLRKGTLIIAFAFTLKYFPLPRLRVETPDASRYWENR